MCIRDRVLSEKQKKLLTGSNPQASRFRSQLKLYKDGMPLRPIVSFLNSPSYRLAKEVNKLGNKLAKAYTN